MITAIDRLTPVLTILATIDAKDSTVTHSLIIYLTLETDSAGTSNLNAKSGVNIKIG